MPPERTKNFRVEWNCPATIHNSDHHVRVEIYDRNLTRPCILSSRSDGGALLPEQLRRHALSAQLAMNCPQVGLRPSRLDLGQRRRGRKQPDPQRLIGHVLGQRPAHLRRPLPLQEINDRVAPIDRLNAILRLDMPAAVSRSTSRILRMGNLAPGMSRSLFKRS